ncbi:MAG TPA: hypothetical protein VF264_01805 [Rhodanobacteraceae bacterium]
MLATIAAIELDAGAAVLLAAGVAAVLLAAGAAVLLAAGVAAVAAGAAVAADAADEAAVSLLLPVLLHADNDSTIADAMATANTVRFNFISDLLEFRVDDHARNKRQPL